MNAEDERAFYAEKIRWMCDRIIYAVHDDLADLQCAIDTALAEQTPPGVDPVVAIVTILAAQVDIDAPGSKRLGWVVDMQPRKLPEDAAGDAVPLRVHVDTLPADEVTDEIIDSVTAGTLPLGTLPPAMRQIPVRRLAEQGWTTEKMAKRLHCSKRTVRQYRQALQEQVSA